jgi:hypothetical protein
MCKKGLEEGKRDEQNGNESGQVRSLYKLVFLVG